MDCSKPFYLGWLMIQMLIFLKPSGLSGHKFPSDIIFVDWPLSFTPLSIEEKIAGLQECR